MGEIHKRNPNTNCKVCGKSIYRRPHEIKLNKGRVFCSLICYGISNRKELPCVVCGKAILAGANKKTCSRACANKHRTGIRYNMNQPRNKVKSSVALKHRLLAQRGLLCQRCGYDNVGILVVHHKDRNRDNNSLENLELICPNCHAEQHLILRNVVKLEKLGGVA